MNEVDSQGQIIAVTNQVIPDDPEEIPGGWRDLFAMCHGKSFKNQKSSSLICFSQHLAVSGKVLDVEKLLPNTQLHLRASWLLSQQDIFTQTSSQMHVYIWKSFRSVLSVI